MDNVLFLGGYTRRSQAYLQCLEHYGLCPAEAVFLGAPSREDKLRENVPVSAPVGDGLFDADFAELPRATCDRLGLAVTAIEDADSVNDAKVVDVLAERVRSKGIEVVVFSGYSGELVGRDVLALPIDVLHVHAGALPQYRGSTTIYYSWIEESTCGASAILLNAQIDEGAVVGKGIYAPPQPGVDVDYAYDTAIRADVLRTVLQAYSRDGAFKAQTQNLETGDTYYVIHPLLKHVALLSREETDKRDKSEEFERV